MAATRCGSRYRWVNMWTITIWESSTPRRQASSSPRTPTPYGLRMLLYISRKRAASVSAGPGYSRHTDLAVEVVSPGDTYAEVESKVEDWLRAGCRLVVVVNPRNQTLKTCRALTDIAVLTVDDTLDAGDVVPGFRLPVRKVFPSS